MSRTRRKHIRLTLDIPAYRFTETGERIEITMYQISIGGCLIDWDESISKDEEFRIEVQLPNGNWLPLQGKALYLVEGDGIGIQFQNITQFEQELIAQIMSNSLAVEGIPMKVDPFSSPKEFVDAENKNSEMIDKFDSKKEIFRFEQ